MTNTQSPLRVAKEIYKKGYRKFDVEELKSWLKKEKGIWDKRDGKNSLGHWLEAERTLKKIKEIELKVKND